MVQLFLEYGADIFKRGGYGKASILHCFCVCCDNADVLKELLARGAALDATDSDKETPLHWLMCKHTFESGSEEIARIMIQAGADVNAEDLASERKSCHKGGLFVIDAVRTSSRTMQV